MLNRFGSLGHLIPSPLGPLESAEDAWNFFMHVNEKGFKEGEPLGLVDIGTRYIYSRELDVFSSYSPYAVFYCIHGISG